MSNDVERVVVVVIAGACQSDTNCAASTVCIVSASVLVRIVEDGHLRIFSVITLTVMDQVEVIVRRAQSPVGGNERRLIAGPIVVII